MHIYVYDTHNQLLMEGSHPGGEESILVNVIEINGVQYVPLDVHATLVGAVSEYIDSRYETPLCPECGSDTSIMCDGTDDIPLHRTDCALDKLEAAQEGRATNEQVRDHDKGYCDPDSCPFELDHFDDDSEDDEDAEEDEDEDEEAD